MWAVWCLIKKRNKKCTYAYGSTQQRKNKIYFVFEKLTGVSLSILWLEMELESEDQEIPCDLFVNTQKTNSYLCLELVVFSL